MPKRKTNQVRIPVEEGPYTVTVHLDLFEAGIAPRVSAITIEAKPPVSVSPRDVRRMPLSTLVEGAVALLTREIADPTAPNVVGHQQKGAYILDLVAGERTAARVPRGRPERGHSTDFYRDLARAYSELAAANVRPVPEIARRKRVDENTVHQWIHRARKLGFLPPSSRGKGKR
jgi:hypothetical protein